MSMIYHLLGILTKEFRLALKDLKYSMFKAPFTQEYNFSVQYHSVPKVQLSWVVFTREPLKKQCRSVPTSRTIEKLIRKVERHPNRSRFP